MYVRPNDTSKTQSSDEKSKYIRGDRQARIFTKLIKKASYSTPLSSKLELNKRVLMTDRRPLGNDE